MEKIILAVVKMRKGDYLMREILIEYDANGKITAVFLPNGEVFNVTSQTDHFVGGKITSTILSNTPIEGGLTNE